MKKLISIALVAFMLLGMIPMAAFAETYDVAELTAAPTIDGVIGDGEYANTTGAVSMPAAGNGFVAPYEVSNPLGGHELQYYWASDSEYLYLAYQGIADMSTQVRFYLNPKVESGARDTIRLLVNCSWGDLGAVSAALYENDDNTPTVLAWDDYVSEVATDNWDTGMYNVNVVELKVKRSALDNSNVVGIRAMTEHEGGARGEYYWGADPANSVIPYMDIWFYNAAGFHVLNLPEVTAPAPEGAFALGQYGQKTIALEGGVVPALDGVVNPEEYEYLIESALDSDDCYAANDPAATTNAAFTFAADEDKLYIGAISNDPDVANWQEGLFICLSAVETSQTLNFFLPDCGAAEKLGGSTVGGAVGDFITSAYTYNEGLTSYEAALDRDAIAAAFGVNSLNKLLISVSYNVGGQLVFGFQSPEAEAAGNPAYGFPWFGLPHVIVLPEVAPKPEVPENLDARFLDIFGQETYFAGAKAATAPVADGVVGADEYGMKVEATEDEFGAFFAPYAGENAAPWAVDWANYYVSYDNEALYIAAEIHDPDHVPHSTFAPAPTRADQFIFTLAGMVNTAAPDALSTAIKFVMFDGDENGLENDAIQVKNIAANVVKGHKVVHSDDTGVTTYELALDLAVIEDNYAMIDNTQYELFTLGVALQDTSNTLEAGGNRGQRTGIRNWGITGDTAKEAYLYLAAQHGSSAKFASEQGEDVIPHMFYLGTEGEYNVYKDQLINGIIDSRFLDAYGQKTFVVGDATAAAPAVDGAVGADEYDLKVEATEDEFGAFFAPYSGENAAPWAVDWANYYVSYKDGALYIAAEIHDPDHVPHSTFAAATRADQFILTLAGAVDTASGEALAGAIKFVMYDGNADGLDVDTVDTRGTIDASVVIANKVVHSDDTGVTTYEIALDLDVIKDKYAMIDNAQFDLFTLGVALQDTSLTPEAGSDPVKGQRTGIRNWGITGADAEAAYAALASQHGVDAKFASEQGEVVVPHMFFLGTEDEYAEFKAARAGASEEEEIPEVTDVPDSAFELDEFGQKTVVLDAPTVAPKANGIVKEGEYSYSYNAILRNVRDDENFYIVEPMYASTTEYVNFYISADSRNIYIATEQKDSDVRGYHDALYLQIGASNNTADYVQIYLPHCDAPEILTETDRGAWRSYYNGYGASLKDGLVTYEIALNRAKLAEVLGTTEDKLLLSIAQRVHADGASASVVWGFEHAGLANNGTYLPSDFPAYGYPNVIKTVSLACDLVGKDHTYVDTKYNESKHLSTCADCGAKIYVDHKVAWESFDDDNHYGMCSCGQTFTAAHILNVKATETATHLTPGKGVKTCLICAYEAETVIPVISTHTFGAFVDNGDTHVATCACGETVTEAHDYVDGRCKCGATVVVDNPVETDPVETDPVETDPVETDPVETEPADEKSGCGASVAAIAVALVAALGTCTVFVAKKRD